MAILTFNTAMKLLTQKKHQTLYDLALSALRKNEKDPLAFFFLGLIATEHGQHMKALEFHAKATEHAPKNARYQASHAKALLTLNHAADAKLRTDMAAQVKTKDAFTADMIGTLYSRMGHHSLALPFFKEAVRLNPKWPIFHFNLAASAQFTGDNKTAKLAYEKAVSLEPLFHRAWFALVSLEAQSVENNHLPELETLFSKLGRDAEAQLLIGHAIAKTYEDLKRFPESLAWLGRAKETHKDKVSYDVSATSRMFAAAKAGPVKSQPAKDTKSEITPLFIVGLPRTGTTLVDRILSSHGKVTSAGELDLFVQILVAKTQTSRLDGAAFIQAAKQTDLSEIGHIYQEKIQTLYGGNAYVIDKTPMNFFYADLIHYALPNARIIGLRRSAMDSCLSNYRQLFALHDRQFDYTYRLDDTAHYYREFSALMTHWRKALPSSHFLEICYEDIVLEQEAATRKLLSFCGLNWDSACLQFHENKAAVDTASSVQVRRPLYTGSIDRWKKYDGKLEGLKAALGDLAET